MNIQPQSSIKSHNAVRDSHWNSNNTTCPLPSDAVMQAHICSWLFSKYPTCFPVNHQLRKIVTCMIENMPEKNVCLLNKKNNIFFPLQWNILALATEQFCITVVTCNLFHNVESYYLWIGGICFNIIFTLNIFRALPFLLFQLQTNGRVGMSRNKSI